MRPTGSHLTLYIQNMQPVSLICRGTLYLPYRPLIFSNSPKNRDFIGFKLSINSKSQKNIIIACIKIIGLVSVKISLVSDSGKVKPRDQLKHKVRGAYESYKDIFKTPQYDDFCVIITVNGMKSLPDFQ